MSAARPDRHGLTRWGASRAGGRRAARASGVTAGVAHPVKSGSLGAWQRAIVAWRLPRLPGPVGHHGNQLVLAGAQSPGLDGHAVPPARVLHRSRGEMLAVERVADRLDVRPGDIHLDRRPRHAARWPMERRRADDARRLDHRSRLRLTVACAVAVTVVPLLVPVTVTVSVSVSPAFPVNEPVNVHAGLVAPGASTTPINVPHVLPARVARFPYTLSTNAVSSPAGTYSGSKPAP